MAILRYQDNQGNKQEREFFKEVLHIGSHPENDIVFATDLGVAPRHAAITFSTFHHLYVLVNLTQRPTWVNRRRVISIQVLEHTDQIQLGRARLVMSELYIRRLAQKDEGKRCPFCKQVLKAGEAVLICPHCSAIYHQLCGFITPHCGVYACNYPFQEKAMDALAPWVAFERHLGDASELVVKRITCEAGNRHDVLPFQRTNNVVFCPSAMCHRPFHWNCWVMLPTCTNPECKYDIQKLLNRAFAQEGPVEEGGAYAR